MVANLVENAVKYTPPGGSVTVRTLSNGEAGGVVLEVADTGPGVPEEERDRLFQRFGRGSARTTGGEPSTGLGLFICREIVEQHGGRVWFEPIEGPGHGSRFFAFWPPAATSSETRDNS
ncbi:MAG: sensor histidine kinase [Planctomycetota bacterium]